jgi:DNA-binding NarL/FixJ family response regulator
VLSGAATADEVAIALAGSGPEPADAPEGDRVDDVVLLRTLTRRELAVLQLLGRGVDTRGIADTLGISVHTVRTHLQNLYAKLGCHRRLEVVRIAARHGLLEGSPSTRAATGPSGPSSRKAR